MNALYALIQFSRAKIDMSKNPLACGKCTDLDSIRWLVRNRYSIVSSDKLECLSEDGKYEVVNEKAIEQLNMKCQMKGKIIFWSMLGGFSLTFALVLIILI